MEIPENLKISKINGPKNIRETVTMDFKLWILSRCKAPLLTNGIKTPLIATKRRHIPYGYLWCDKGVYHIAN